ncbi:OLC1v1022841C1 [Oldenlandia corymbosa var. corymbosa]|uniref:OLC1v1022841C1 n=1 Tax=Oldenlandia corymbosa var. corymbosa TaxID=529605 RepID=A0AAV1BYZ1_OLDCO|nr:OLC1v1022841C1 [Oldenlandia corymbosa var. corymbosa]
MMMMMMIRVTLMVALIIIPFFCSLISPQPILAGNQQPTSHPDDDDDLCAAKQCWPDGPAVRFPWFLQGMQPESCGFNSSYKLHCDHLNRTILQLSPSSIQVSVRDIDYSSPEMFVQLLQTCLVKQLLDRNLSTLDFQNRTQQNIFGELNFTFTLLNCSSHHFGLFPVPCLGNERYGIYAVGTDEIIIGDPVGRDDRLWESCTKMNHTITSSVPLDILSEGEGHLYWPTFPPCESCEARGGICRWVNRTANLIGCRVLEGNRVKRHSEILKILQISGTIIGCLVLIILILGASYLAYSTVKLDRENRIRLKKFLEDYVAMKPTRYSYAEIKKITNEFKVKLGGGGYGNVYKGQVGKDVFVAVKLLHNSSENGEEFINEVGTMGTIHHVNVVRLLGFCADGYKRALVYEFLPNGSLDKFIFPNCQPQQTLGMQRLQHIAIGIARGIEYLHQGCEQRILHFDIKPHNILLDHNYNPKISDFGLAKLCDKGRSHVSMTAARGTMGYIAPEVFSRHLGANVSYKSDIYSFGKLLLEMVGQRKNVDANVKNLSQANFPEWVYKRLVNGEEFGMIQDVEDGPEMNQIARKLAKVGLWCIQWSPVDRPSISTVLQLLEGSGETLSLPPNPFTTSSSGNAINPADPSEHGMPTLAAISELE